MDIVERLRLGGPNAAEVTDEAADEIARLRAALREILDWKQTCDWEAVAPWVRDIYEWNTVIQRAETIARKALGLVDDQT